MSISIKNIKDIESKSFTISGLPKEIGIVDGSTVTVVWANDIHVELIDVQTILPFDVNHRIKQSLEKTNRLLLVDEDVSGGACGFMLDKILTEQKAYFTLDSAPVTLTSKDHRPAYGSDGDYFSKPNLEDIIEKVMEIMHEVNPTKYPKIY